MASLWKQGKTHQQQPCDEMPNTAGHGRSVNVSHISLLLASLPGRQFENTGHGSVLVKVHVAKLDYLRSLK